MNKNFGGVIWTKHALSRMRERGIKQGDAWATFRRPEQSKRGKLKGAWVYYKTWSNQKIEVIAKKNERREWIILSVWSQDVSREPHSTGSKPTFGGKKIAESLWKLIKKRVF